MDKRENAKRRTEWNSWVLLPLTCVLGLALGGVLLARHARSFSTSAGGTDASPELDSFSEPDIAVAVLKKHAQELRETCTFEINLARERDLRAHWTLKTPPQHYLDQPLEQPLNRMRSASDAMPISSRESGSASAFQAGLAQWIPRLRAELKRQSQAAADAELAHMYLMLCKAGGQWEAFLDVYLGMLIASPEHNDVPSWAPVALSQARFYGRTEEILDALQHMIRFHRDRDAAARIQVAVDRWLACNRSNYTVQVR